VAQGLAEAREPMARLIAREAGKPLRDAYVEVDRGCETLRLSAEEATRIAGEEVPIASAPGAENRLAFTIRRPYGVVLAITPFNFPLNLALHKVGPAVASGNAVVLKPAPQTPLTALALARLFEAAGLPPGWLNVVTAQGPELGQALVADPGVDLITFTGSAAVGQAIRQAAGLRPVLLELGNNAAVIVHRDADLKAAAESAALRSFAFAGQVCIAVQRVLVHEEVRAEFTERFEAATRALKLGDPENVETDIGPMITPAAAERADRWAEQALARGARALLRGRREGAMLGPTVLLDPPADEPVVAEEAFAPLVSLFGYRDLDDALQRVNASRYGLQAAIFTQDLDVAMRAAQALEVGGVIVNDAPSYRADLMPYGGVKHSGLGREGPKYAVQEMTYPRVVVLNLKTPR
jgi:acyl-CoA reductase-like NAD-dependent aldehyde dehydrogenase